MELWGDEPNVYTIGILSPGGENIERMQLKMGEFRSVRFFPEDTLLEIRSFPGATIGGSQVIRMNFKNIVSGIWKLFVYGTGNGEKQYDIWLPISNFLKEETVFINPSSEQTVTSPGNAQYALAYAAYDVATGGLYVRASKGYTRDGRIVPDLAAPGVSVGIPGVSRITGAGERAISRERVRSGSSVAAVSYTHLDVYKRQTDTNRVTIISEKEEKNLELMSKEEVADEILNYILEMK